MKKWILRILHILVVIVKTPFDLLAIPSHVFEAIDEEFENSGCWK